MSLSRRDFVRHGALLAASAAIPARLQAAMRRGPGGVVSLSSPEARELAMRALDAARAAGAAHAEVRLSHLRRWDIYECTGCGPGVTGIMQGGTNGTNTDVLAIGIRALVGGTWGFASSAILTADEAARMGTEAARQARTTARAGMAPR